MPFAEVSGRKIEYNDFPAQTERDGVPPLLLVMGLGGSCRGWQPLQVPAFTEHRRTITYDHRGVAGSEDPGGPFSTADLADDAEALLECLDIPEADVLGAFMGGMAAQELALRHPKRVARLVLSGTYDRADAKRRMLLEDWKFRAQSNVPYETLLRQRLMWTLLDDSLEQTDLIDEWVAFFLREGLPMAADLFARQCDACLAHDTSARLGEIGQPTLVICGHKDSLTPPKFHRELADKIPSARLVTIRYGAHMVMAESAERYNHAVLQFLDEDR